MKNKILKTITAVAAIVAMFSACSVDSKSLLPCAVLVICLAWLLLFGYANKERFQSV